MMWVMLMKSSKASSFTKFWSFTFVLMPLLLYIPMSRVYVGNHSYDQVTIGFIEGVLLVMLFGYTLERDIRNWHKNLDKYSVLDILIHPQAVFIFVTNALMLYIQKQHKAPIPQLWIDNIESVCGVMGADKKNPDRQSIELCILAFGSIGNSMGALFERKALGMSIYEKWN